MIKLITPLIYAGHPWLRDENHPIPLDIQTFKLVKSYIRATSFKRAALKVCILCIIWSNKIGNPSLNL